AKLPREDVALKFIGDLGVPMDAAKRAFDQILAAGKTVRFFNAIGGNQFIDLNHSVQPHAVGNEVSVTDDEQDRPAAPKPDIPKATTTLGLRRTLSARNLILERGESLLRTARTKTSFRN